MELQIQDLVSSIKQDGIDSANREAAAIVAQAKAQAESIISQAKADADKLLQDANPPHEDGHGGEAGHPPGIFHAPGGRGPGPKPSWSISSLTCKKQHRPSLLQGNASIKAMVFSTKDGCLPGV